MSLLIRRSNLLVPVTHHLEIDESWMHNADAITLDLEDSIPATHKEHARELIQDTIGYVGRGAAEVFVRVNKPFVYADLDASVWQGLTGIILPQVESADDVTQAANLLTELEQQRALHIHSLQIIIWIETGQGLWSIREIVRASSRITQVGLDESDLAGAFGIMPMPDYDPFVYARGRLVVEAIAAGVQPIGVAYPLGTQPSLLPRGDLFQKATDAKNLGFQRDHLGIRSPYSPREWQVLGDFMSSP